MSDSRENYNISLKINCDPFVNRRKWHDRWSRRILVATVSSKKVEVHAPLPDRTYVLGWPPNLKSNSLKFSIMEHSSCLQQVNNHNMSLNSYFISFSSSFTFKDYIITKFSILYSNIIVQGITIFAPVTSPNTDGINPGQN